MNDADFKFVSLEELTRVVGGQTTARTAPIAPPAAVPSAPPRPAVPVSRVTTRDKQTDPPLWERYLPPKTLR